MSENRQASLIVVTGAGGFIGRRLVAALTARGHPVRAVTRSKVDLPSGMSVEQHEISDLRSADWAAILPGADAIIHTAAVAHRADPDTTTERKRIWAINVEATGNLAEAACRSGVRRMILLSSIGVLGSQSSGDKPFVETSTPAPHDFYSSTKLESERAATSAAARAGVELSIVRPPLVFGPDAPGNFGRLMKCIQRGIPLPLGSIHNRRSLVSVWNLCDFLVACLTSPGAVGAPLLIADEEVISTAELLRRCTRILGNRLPPLPIPVALLRLAATALGRAADIQRLCGTLVVDPRESQARTGWRPGLSLSDGLYRTLRPEHGSTIQL